jgi:adenylate cyclase
MQRRLAAILAADVVSYSRLMGKDETGTLERLKELRSNLAGPSVTSHNGRIVKLTGDGWLAEFSSVVEAVQCAVEIQRKVAEGPANLDEGNRITLRIGVNLGDIIVDGDEIYGDGVNVAARVEGLAPPGGVAVSGAAYDHVVGKINVQFEDAGERQLKNIARPVRIWQWPNGMSDARERGLASQITDKPSIAVLPFKNMAGDADDDFFVDGITEEIMTGLGRFREIVVAARGSSVLVGAESLDVSDAAKKLGVQYLLKGSVRRGGDRVRITANLIDGQTGNQVWSERYDRVLDDIFEVQDDVARAIVTTLAGSIERADQARSLRKAMTDLSAYECVLRGRHFYGEWGKGRNDEEVIKAREMFEKAIEIDERCAPAYAGLAATYLTEYERGWSDAPQTAGEHSLAFARKAVEIDDDDSYAHLILASANWKINRDWERSRSQLAAAIERNPNYYWSYCFGSWFCACAGDLALSLDHGQEAIRRSPLLPDGCLVTLGYTEYLSGRYEHAIANFTRMTNMDEEACAVLAASYAQLGRHEEAAAAAAEFRETSKKEPMDSADWSSFLATNMPFKEQEPIERLLEGLGKAGLIADGTTTNQV